jgi:hypothetical protein
VVGGGRQPAVHLVEQRRALQRAPRRRGDRRDEPVLFLAQHAVAQPVALLEHAAHAHARPTDRVGEIERRRRHREARGLEAEVSLQQAVGDLVVAPAADAVDELVGQEQAQDRRQRQGARGEAEVVGAEPCRQLFGGARGCRLRL